MLRCSILFFSLMACNHNSDGKFSMDTSGGYESYPEPSADWESTDAPEDYEDSSESDIVAGTLTAGEWNDIENWEFWLDLIDNPESDYFEYPKEWGFSPNQKIEFVLFDGDLPAIDTQLHMFDANKELVWQSRTNNHGIAQLYPNMFQEQVGPFSVEIETQEGMVEYTQTFEIPVHKSLAMEIDSVPTEKIVDLMFVVDTTSSMCDELMYLQTELHAVINESKASFADDAILRASVNFYRDVGDEYVTRPFPFSEDIEEVNSQLGAQGCAGGGDYPEAVAQALSVAVDGHAWSPSAQARLLFLVLDAPPHDDEQTLSSIRSSIEKASELGIQIIPVASSGIDKQTEFFLRSIDIATNGTYVFLTGHSGIGDEHIKASVGDFEVQPLNDLLVQLILDATTIE